MALPKISTPLIPITLPTTGEELTIRQFLTKEYKAIMSAYNTKNVGVFVKTVSEIVKSCVVKPENFDLNKYHSYDIDYIFLQLYTISVSGVIDISVTCNHKVEKPVIVIDDAGFPQETGETTLEPCNTVYNMEINSRDVKISDIHDGVFKIDESLILKLRYPDWEMWHQVAQEANLTMDDLSSDDEYNEDDFEKNQDEMARILFKCVKEIWINDEKWEEEYTLDEFKEWIDTFPTDKLEEVMSFVQNTPQLYWRQEVTCPSCGNKGTINMVGLESFLK